MHDTWQWTTLALLGAYHGINPGMGWLFAVALGLQERSRAAVLRALPPIALGHAASIAVVALGVAALQSEVPYTAVRWILGALLIGFGVYKLVVTRHPRWVGMLVGFRDLTIWSFLMASAHGAGLMLVPVLTRMHSVASTPLPGEASASAAPAISKQMAASMPANCPMLHAAPAVSGSAHALSFWPTVAAVGVHTASMLLVAGLVALVVYEKVGLNILRKAWFNLDRVWAIALIGAGIVAASAF